jgi:hypothetical protein
MFVNDLLMYGENGNDEETMAFECEMTYKKEEKSNNIQAAIFVAPIKMIDTQ